MKTPCLIILLIIPALACGVSAPLPAVMANATSPAIATQTRVETPTAPAVTETTRAPRPLAILDGCWNIRSSPADLQDANIIRIQCGGAVEVVQWAANGYLELTGGEYVCNRAVGGEVECW